jgi:branched-chain amino acid transport system substrate-binding protein
MVLMGTTDSTALILKAAEKLSLTSRFTWIAGSVGGDANTLLALGVKPATIDGITPQASSQMLRMQLMSM